ncbi:MAG: GAF domain-containing protein, partial [Chloroflexota bacterium]
MTAPDPARGQITIPEHRRARRQPKPATQAPNPGADANPDGAARSETIQSALYRIAETASAAQDMPSFYAAIHEIVGELMYADNFYIALYDEERALVNYPFYRDELDDDLPDPSVWEPIGEGQAAGFTGNVLRHGEPVLFSAAEQQAMVERGEVVLLGIPSVDWMAAPLKADGHTIGVVVTQSYREDRKHTAEDLELLTFVAQHIATALTRARAIEETRQRNAELALVNEIGAALAKQLDFETIIDLVGERLATMFQASDMYIGLYDRSTNLISFPFELELGKRMHGEPIELGQGLSSIVLQQRRALRFGTLEDQVAAGAVVATYPDGASSTVSESWLGVPILAGPEAIGVIGFGEYRAHAYTEGDERVLSTVASSMGVALQNAKLFEETKRLLSEADERAAELAVVNSVQQAL